MDTIIDIILGNTLTNRHWAVTPCIHPLAFGVPLYRYSDPDGRMVETAITPLDRPGERCPELAEALSSILERPNMETLLHDAIDGAPQAVIDSIRAHITHKRLVTPAGAGYYPVDPEAGILRSENGDVGAVLVGTHQDVLGVLEIERLDRGADIRVRWVEQGDFIKNRDGFINACDGLTHEDLLAGLDGKTQAMAIEGIAARLKDQTRVLPNLVAGAFISQVIEDLDPGHPARRRAQQLLDAISVAEGPVCETDYGIYANALATLRQNLVLVAQKRKPGREPAFEQLVARQTWLDLYESIIDSMVEVCMVVDGGTAPNRAAVRTAIENVADTSDDPYTKAMQTRQGTLMSGIGELVDSLQITVDGEGEIEVRFRQLAYLLGRSGWQAARPFDFGVLCAVIGGW